MKTAPRLRILAAGTTALVLLASVDGLARVSVRRLHPMSTMFSGASVAAGPDGTPHLLYPSEDDRPRHAWRENGRWRDEPVDDRLGWFDSDAVEVDSLGRVHAAWIAAWGEGLGEASILHGVRDAAGWTIREVPVGFGTPHLALGSDDRPRLLYGGESTWRVAREVEDGVWSEIDTGFATGPYYQPASLEVDAADRLHILVPQDGRLVYATDAAGGWDPVPVPESVGQGSLAVEPDGRVHVGGMEGDGLPVRPVHLRLDDSGWRRLEIPTPTRGEARTWHLTELRADPEGRLFAALSGTSGDGWSYPRVAWFDGASWRTKAAGGKGAGGAYSLARGSVGEMHLALSGWRVSHVRVTLPDLALTWEQGEATQVAGGLRFRGTLRVRNLGSARTRPTEVAFLRSTDAVPGPEDERRPRGSTVPSLRPGGEAMLRIDLRLPGAAAGDHLIAVADPDARREDLDRRNDAATLRLEAKQGP
jgi:hypothetical protein